MRMADDTQGRRLRSDSGSAKVFETDPSSRLEELEEIVSAIGGGLVDAVVVDREGQTEVWTLEAADRMHLRLALEAANAGTWDWNLRTGRVHCSEGLLKILGLSHESQITVEEGNELIHAEDRQQWWERLQASLSGDTYYDEVRIVRPDGAVRWLESRGRMIRDLSGESQRLVGVSLDITERKSTEEALRLADRRKDEFMAMLAHELRNPLAAMSNALRLRRRGSLAAQDGAWAEEILERQMGLLGRLVDDLLDVARITRGRIELKKELVQLSELAKRAVDAARPQMDRAHHQLTVSLPSAALWVEGDPARLEQVLVNLLTNAAKYTKEGGQVGLTVSREGQQAVIAIKDTGIGLSADMLPRVFDMFAQAEQGLDRAQGGLGIGLTLVRSLVEMHGGTVAATSPGPALGSEFTVRLPLVEAPRQFTAVKNPAPAAVRPQRILIVDDNHDAATTLAFLLKASGHKTEIAFEGTQALDKATAFEPTVALLDIGLPGMDGYQLAACLKEAYPGLCLVALSGYGQADDRARAKEAGFNAHFIKPVMIDDLLGALEKQVGK
jgi:PAS domain S-box-containing protein